MNAHEARARHHTQVKQNSLGAPEHLLLKDTVYVCSLLPVFFSLFLFLSKQILVSACFVRCRQIACLDYMVENEENFKELFQCKVLLMTSIRLILSQVQGLVEHFRDSCGGVISWLDLLCGVHRGLGIICGESADCPRNQSL